MHIFFFSHKLPLLLFTCILCQQSFAADQTHPDRAALKAIRDFTLASDSSSSPSNQGALLPLTPDPVNTAHNDGDDPAASIMSASKKECSSSSSTGGNTKTSENKRRRRSSSGESCEWDDNGKGSETEMGTDYDIHIPDTFVDRSKHQFFYPHTLEEDPSTCEAPLLTPVCDDGSYMIAQPDSRAPINPFHFNLPFCRPQFLYKCQWPERLWCCFRALRNDEFPEVLSDVIIYTYTGYNCILKLENLLPPDPVNHRPL